MGLLSVDLSVRDELKRSLPIAQRTGIEFPATSQRSWTKAKHLTTK